MKRGRPVGITRDWRVILADAKARGLSTSDVAREQGVATGTVYRYSRDFEVNLRHGQTKIDWHTALLGAALKGQAANDFCREWEVSFPALQQAEKRHGVKLIRPRFVKKAEQERAA